MPLLMPTLQSELIGIYEKGPSGNPAPPLVGIKTATAYLNFVTPGINAGAGSTIAMPGSIALGTDLRKYTFRNKSCWSGYSSEDGKSV